jgi:hypothetical protein
MLSYWRTRTKRIHSFSPKHPLTLTIGSNWRKWRKWGKKGKGREYYRLGASEDKDELFLHIIVEHRTFGHFCWMFGIMFYPKVLGYIKRSVAPHQMFDVSCCLNSDIHQILEHSWHKLQKFGVLWYQTFGNPNRMSSQDRKSKFTFSSNPNPSSTLIKDYLTLLNILSITYKKAKEQHSS